MATRCNAGCFAFALASPVRAVDSLDAIRADLSPPGGAIHAEVSPRAKIPLIR